LQDEIFLDLINLLQEMFLRHVEMAFTKELIDEVTYRRFVTETCEARTEDEVFDHFQRLYADLKEIMRSHLLMRIVKGAEFIESIDTKDARYQAAMAKYDALCKELRDFDARESA